MRKVNRDELEPITKQRFEIIHRNFFLNLKIKKISFSKYAKDNMLNSSIGSHWKSGKSKMTVDQIYQAADYFDITVNDLYYSDKEKKGIAVLTDSSYDPIIAQKTLNIRLMNDSFENPFTLVLPSVVSYILITFITYYLLQSSPYWFLIILMGLYLYRASFNSIFSNNRTLIVNYLDDIYYKRKSHKNKYIVLQFLIRVLSIIGVFFVISLTRFNQFDSSSDIRIVLVLYIMFNLIYIVVVAFSFVLMDIKYSLMIDDNQIQGYMTSITIFNFSLILLSGSFILLISDFL